MGGTLESQLSASRIDGRRVGATLEQLGQQTVATAGDDSMYSTLGEALIEAGEGLGRDLRIKICRRISVGVCKKFEPTPVKISQSLLT